jgi:hypothetical protein
VLVRIDAAVTRTELHIVLTRSVDICQPWLQDATLSVLPLHLLILADQTDPYDVLTPAECQIRCCRYTAKGDAQQSQGATHIRALFARGRIMAHAAHACKGEALVNGVQRALKPVQEGLSAAKASDCFASLLHSGSVHFWQIVTPLMRPGVCKHLVDSFAAMQASLAALPGHEGWKARVAAACAQCLGDVRLQHPLTSWQPIVLVLLLHACAAASVQSTTC